MLTIDLNFQIIRQYHGTLRKRKIDRNKCFKYEYRSERINNKMTAESSIVIYI